jgi:alkanesulfonate monooxygenase SsuD/methylene tetrahydromethanopterin reductase-like flavin-dependent oxidoreductase (luciferase family)
VITGATEEEVEKAKAPVRQQLSFYASTRSYHPVLEVHGWEETGQKLFRLSMEGNWPEMAKGITDEMLEHFAIIGTYDELLPKIKERYQGVVTTLDFGFGVRSASEEERIAHLVGEIKKL